MSSAAICAALVIDAPATDDSSPMTPILIGSLVCATAPSDSASVAPSAVPPIASSRKAESEVCFDWVIRSFLLILSVSMNGIHRTGLHEII